MPFYVMNIDAARLDYPIEDIVNSLITAGRSGPAVFHDPDIENSLGLIERDIARELVPERALLVGWTDEVARAELKHGFTQVLWADGVTYFDGGGSGLVGGRTRMWAAKTTFEDMNGIRIHLVAVIDSEQPPSEPWVPIETIEKTLTNDPDTPQSHRYGKQRLPVDTFFSG